MTTSEEMPISEALELYEAAREILQIRCGKLILNQGQVGLPVSTLPRLGELRAAKNPLVEFLDYRQKRFEAAQGSGG